MATSIFNVPVTIVGEIPLQAGPLLYEWRIYSGTELTCLYIGKAKNGADRPLKTYPSVVADLSKSRDHKSIQQIPTICYFKRNPWGFRWIHHQLESCVNHILCSKNTENKRIELTFSEVGIHSSKLNAAEKAAIAHAKLTYVGTSIVANGMPSMRRQYKKSPHLLDAVWLIGKPPI